MPELPPPSRPPLPLAATTLPELYVQRVARTPQREAYRQFDPDSGRWQHLSWQQSSERVARWRQALLAQGLGAGARVAMLLPNGWDPVCMDLAALSLGLVPVPLHAMDNPDSLAYILQDSEAALLLVDTLSRWQSIAGAGLALPDLRRVVLAQAPSTAWPPDSVVISLSDWLALGQAAARADPMHSRPAATNVSADHLAAIVYTSGTTGRPKGVMLTHRNVMSNIEAALQRFQVKQDDVLLSLLPLSHTLERTVGYYLPIAAGACVAYARSVAQLMDDLRAVRPSALVSAPRIYERLHAQAWQATAGRGGRRLLLEWTLRLGWQNFLAAQGRGRHSRPRQLAGWLLQALVARPMLKVFGGRLRLAICAGAPLNASVAQFFLGLGLNLLQGYGMTETAPLVSCNTPTDNEPLSVGRPMPGVQVRIGDNSELLVAGPNVMLGYWKRTQDTHRVLDADGWLHSGDQAQIINGRIHIAGRIKDLIAISTGEKIAPAELEMAIQADPLFSQVLVVGEQRPYLVALAVLDAQRWREAATQAGLDPDLPAALHSASAQRLALQRIAHTVKTFPAYASPKRVWLSTQAWTIDAGLMTPTLKLKRPALERHFAAQIDALYAHRPLSSSV